MGNLLVRQTIHVVMLPRYARVYLNFDRLFGADNLPVAVRITKVEPDEMNSASAEGDCTHIEERERFEGTLDWLAHLPQYIVRHKGQVYFIRTEEGRLKVNELRGDEVTETLIDSVYAEVIEALEQIDWENPNGQEAEATKQLKIGDKVFGSIESDDPDGALVTLRLLNYDDSGLIDVSFAGRLLLSHGERFHPFGQPIKPLGPIGSKMWLIVTGADDSGNFHVSERGLWAQILKDQIASWNAEMQADKPELSPADETFPHMSTLIQVVGRTTYEGKPALSVTLGPPYVDFEGIVPLDQLPWDEEAGDKERQQQEFFDNVQGHLFAQAEILAVCTKEDGNFFVLLSMLWKRTKYKQHQKL